MLRIRFAAALAVCAATAAGQYCPASTTTGLCSTPDEYVSNVQFGAINNASPCFIGYSDFTGTVPAETVVAGQSYPITVTVTNYFSTDRVTVWLDADGDQVFEAHEATNIPLIGTPPAGGVATYSGAVSVAEQCQAVTGTRLRVVLAWNIADPQPACGSIGYGEREDYLVDVLPGGFCLSASAGPNLTLGVTGGVPGAAYVMALTLNQGAFPNGWWYGLDIPVFELLTEVNAGFPFFGLLDANGAMVLSFPFPNLGVVVYGVATEYQAPSYTHSRSAPPLAFGI